MNRKKNKMLKLLLTTIANKPTKETEFKFADVKTRCKWDDTYKETKRNLKIKKKSK